LETRQKYFLPARQLSNPPELSKSGGENRHRATLRLSCLKVKLRSSISLPGTA
jgi:hypothetical protein